MRIPSKTGRCMSSVAVLFGLAAACSSGTKAVDDPHPLAGSWIRVFPEAGALDTMVLHADGRV